jgi:hypothetical protein
MPYQPRFHAWPDRRSLNMAAFQAATGITRDYLSGLRRRGVFEPENWMRFRPRDAAHALLLRDALGASVHLWRGPRNGKQNKVLEKMLAMLDEVIDACVRSGRFRATST